MFESINGRPERVKTVKHGENIDHLVELAEAELQDVTVSRVVLIYGWENRTFKKGCSREEIERLCDGI